MITALGNVALQELCDSISQNALDKEAARYYTLDSIQNTPTQQLLPQITVSNPANKETKNGDWMLQSEVHKLKVTAFIMAMSEMQDMKLIGNEAAGEALDKMTSAAGNITVIILEHEDEIAFAKNYNDGENADHDQMQWSNARFTNRAKLFIRSRIQLRKNGKTDITAQDIVAYFTDLEAKKKISTAFSKNKVSNADDVTRVEKIYGFLLTHHLNELYEKLEWSPECGPTPLSQWGTSRYFMAVVESDPGVATFVLRSLEHIIFGEEDPSSKCKKEKVLESNKKLHMIMKTMVLEFKMMRDLMKSLETKPVAAAAKMQSDFQVLKKFLDFPAAMELLGNSTGILQNLTLPAQRFHELCEKNITQKLFGKFAEVEQNNQTYQKMYKSTILTELIEPITTLWEDQHVQFMPEEKKVEWDGHEATNAGEAAGDVTLTRSEAKKRVGTSDRDGYAKHYVLTKDDDVDKRNLSDFMICKTTAQDAPQNLETQAGS